MEATWKLLDKMRGRLKNGGMMRKSEGERAEQIDEGKFNF
jgi:hypothetical protein